MTRFLQAVLGAPSSSTRTVCGCNPMIRNGPVFRGCSLTWLAFVVSFAILALLLNGCLSTNNHRLGTNSGLTWTLAS